MKRRQMTQFLALAAGGMAVSAFAGVPISGGSGQDHTVAEYLSREFFESLLGSEFGVGEHGARRLRLAAVESACCHHEREQFHAIFEANPGTPLAEGIYILESGSRPRMGLFMTATDQSSKQQRLVATINLQSSA
jgi:hypothetical protein